MGLLWVMSSRRDFSRRGQLYRQKQTRTDANLASAKGQELTSPLIPNQQVGASRLPASFILVATACKCRRLLKRDAVDERIGMTMRQLPFRPVLAVYFSYAQ